MKTINQMETEAILAMGETIKHHEEEIKILRERLAKYEQGINDKLDSSGSNKVKDLANYAFDLAEDMSNEKGSMLKYRHELYDEIFAKLIINECCSSIMQKDRHRREYFAAVIKKHFGILDGVD